MPDKIIEIPGVGNIAFPDTMDEAAINAAAAKLYQEKQGQTRGLLGNMRPMPSHAPAQTSQDRVMGLLGQMNQRSAELRQRAVEHPIATAAEIGLAGAPKVVTALGRTAAPYVAPALRWGAGKLQDPLVSGAIGAVSGGMSGGMPGAMAGGTAGVVSGLPVARGLKRIADRMDPPVRKARTARTTASATSSAPSAPAPAAPTLPAASGARTSVAPPSAASGWSPQRIRNEVGLAARREKVKLSDEQYAQADAMVKQGTAPIEAVRAAAKVSAPPSPMAAASATKPRLNVEEGRLYMRLRDSGKSHEETVRAIEAMRTISARFGTPNTDTVVRKVVERNVSGRWPK